MTVCIGALSRHDNAYVTVSDMMLSVADSHTLDGATIKTQEVGKRCLIGYSGDASEHFNVYVDMMIALDDNGKRDEYPIGEIAEELEKVYTKNRIDWSNGFLSKYGTTLDQFRREGKKNFSPSMYARLWKHIEDEWQLDFVVGGFEGNKAFLFSLDDDGRIAWEMDSPFCAIGIGADASNAILYHTFGSATDKYELAARLLEAKFVAERTPYVGRATFLTVLNHDGTKEVVMPWHPDEHRKIWQMAGQGFMQSSAAALRQNLVSAEVMNQIFSTAWEQYDAARKKRDGH